MRTSDLPISGLNVAFVLGEIVELIEAIVALSWTDICDEACDVYTGIICVLYLNTGIDIPVYWQGAGNRWLKRVKQITWRLNNLGYAFKEEYLVGGSNIERQEKWWNILTLAKEDQGEYVWLYRFDEAVKLIRESCDCNTMWPGCVDCCSDGCYLDTLRGEEEEFFKLV